MMSTWAIIRRSSECGSAAALTVTLDRAVRECRPSVHHQCVHHQVGHRQGGADPQDLAVDGVVVPHPPAQGRDRQAPAHPGSGIHAPPPARRAARSLRSLQERVEEPVQPAAGLGGAGDRLHLPGGPRASGTRSAGLGPPPAGASMGLPWNCSRNQSSEIRPPSPGVSWWLVKEMPTMRLPAGSTATTPLMGPQKPGPVKGKPYPQELPVLRPGPRSSGPGVGRSFDGPTPDGVDGRGVGRGLRARKAASTWVRSRALSPDATRSLVATATELTAAPYTAEQEHHEEDGVEGRVLHMRLPWRGAPSSVPGPLR